MPNCLQRGGLWERYLISACLPGKAVVVEVVLFESAGVTGGIELVDM